MYYIVDKINPGYYYYLNYNFSTDAELHKIALKLLKHPDNKKIEQRYKEILSELDNKNLAKSHDENIQLRRDAIRLLRQTKKLKLKSEDLGTITLSAIAGAGSLAGGLYMLTIGLVHPISFIIPALSLAVILDSLHDQHQFNKAIRAIVKDYKKSLIKGKIYDTAINLEYEYPKSEVKKLDKVRVLANNA